VNRTGHRRGAGRHASAPRRRPRGVLAGAGATVAMLAWLVLAPPPLPLAVLAAAAFNLSVSGLEARWRLYGWRTPDAGAQLV
jgi:hypothetical protein